jgi:hypothetical protein
MGVPVAGPVGLERRPFVVDDGSRGHADRGYCPPPIAVIITNWDDDR